MKVIRDYENTLTAEKIMLYIKCQNQEMFLELAEDLLDDIKENDALHPALAYEWKTVSKIDGDVVWFDDVPFACRQLAEKMHVGSRAVVVMATAGTVTDDYSRDLDDDLDKYIMQGVMQLCLSDSCYVIEKTMKEEVPERHMMMIKPGIEGICEMSEMEHLLEMLPGVAAELGVTRRPDGLMMPVYTNLSIFFMAEGESNIPADDASDEEIAAFEEELNVAAGHV